MIGTGAVIAIARHIPVAMMLTEEIDIYAERVDDPGLVSDLIDGSIGRDSLFHRTFGYYGDGVSPSAAIMPSDWRSRAVEYVTPDGFAAAIFPSAEDIAVAKLCAWREKIRHGCAKCFGPASPRRIGSPLCCEPVWLARRLRPRSLRVALHGRRRGSPATSAMRG